MRCQRFQFSDLCFQHLLTPGRLVAARRGIVTSLFTTLFVAFTAMGSANAAPLAHYRAAPGGSLVISGTSTLHDWTAKSIALTGNAVFAGQWTGKGGAAIDLQSIHLVFAVKSLKSSEGGGMDDTMYSALHIKKHAFITYQLTAAHLLASPAGKTDPAVFKTTGTLKVNGVIKTVPLVLTVTPLASGGLSVTTTAKLKMTDFGVKPPTAMFGVIRSGDAITVTVTWPLAAITGT